jgi:pyruvate carboxylase subunit B
VRADLGYPPLVTPSSQICGSQAVLNVLLGERYKMVPKEVKSIVKGMYGLTPAPISLEMKKLVLGDEVPIDCRPADLLEPEMEKAKAEIGALAKSEEDVLSYVLFPPVAKEFLANRGKKAVELSGDQIDGRVEKPEIARQAAPVSVPTPVAAAASAAPMPPGLPATGERITAPLPGKILSVAVKTGDRVRKGDELCVIEAMKMGNSIRAQRDGVVAEVLVAASQSVAFGASLLVLD